MAGVLCWGGATDGGRNIVAYPHNVPPRHTPAPGGGMARGGRESQRSSTGRVARGCPPLPHPSLPPRSTPAPYPRALPHPRYPRAPSSRDAKLAWGSSLRRTIVLPGGRLLRQAQVPSRNDGTHGRDARAGRTGRGSVENPAVGYPGRLPPKLPGARAPKRMSVSHISPQSSYVASYLDYAPYLREVPPTVQ